MTPLRARPLDLVLVLAFGGFACSTFTVDLWAVTGRMHGDDALARALRGYTEAADPLFGQMPTPVWVLMLVSLVFFGPMDVAVVWALARGRSWIRVPGLFFCGMQFAAMSVYFLLQAFGDTPPRSWPVVIAANGPYLLFPLLLASRLTREPLFSAPPVSSSSASPVADSA